MANPRTTTGCRSKHRAVRLIVAVCSTVMLWDAGVAVSQIPTEPPVYANPLTSPAVPPSASMGQVPPSQDQASPQAPSAPGPGQMPIKPGEEMVVDVRIAGNTALPLEKILPHIRTRVGRPFNLDMISEDVRRLDKTHMFVNVKTYSQKVDGGRVVIFEVLERPLLKEVLFVGCKEINKRVLQKEADIKAGDAVDPLMIEEARRKLEEFYHKRGFTRARITLQEGAKQDDRRAIFLINEGPKVKVWAVNYVGNTIASGDRLQTQIKSKHPFLYLFGGEYDRKQLDEDKERLTAYYRSLGFFRARIGEPIIETNEKGNWATITYAIDEGARYKIRNVSVIGNTKFASEVLLAELKLKNSDYFDQAKLTADATTMSDKYGSIGYVFSDVKPENRFLEEPGQLDIVYNIKEGSRYRVGKIDIAIKGEYPHTMETTIRNRLSLVPGQIVDIRKVRDSERRIKASGLFENKPGTEVPKIAFSPPGKSDEDETEVAEKPKRPTGGSNFRGQSPDPQPHTTWYTPSTHPPAEKDRNLVLVVDCRNCGRYIGPQEPEAAQPRTVGDVVSLPALQNGRGPSGSQDPLSKAMTVLVGGAAATKNRQPAVQTHYTQYSPDAGVSTPTVQRSPTLHWANAQATTVGTSSSNTATEPVTVSNGLTDASVSPQAASPQAGAPQAAPVQPAPQVAQEYPANARQPLINAPDGNMYPGPIFDPNSPFNGGPPDGGEQAPTLPIGVSAIETMTGRVSFGVGVNSDSGLIGSVVLDEQNFNWARLPTSWEDIRNGTAFRGAGQQMRIEAVPGTSTSRYMITFADPYMFDTRVALGLSGYYYTRIYSQYTEQRLGGRVSFGYQFTHDLTGTVAYSGAKINITDPIVPTPVDLLDVLHRDLAMHDFALSLTHDTRDNRFLATQGHLIEGTIEQVLGSFEYPRASVDVRKYFGTYERPDGSGRHVLTLAGRAGWSGDNTPIYDRYYAGGFSTIRGFAFRGVSPIDPATGVIVGGDFQLLGSAEYMFPITADDMLRAVVFCDTGTVEPTIKDWNDKYRVAPGFGLRIAVPAMGPAPIALDFAFPVCSQAGDKREVFSFFMGFGR